MVACPAVSDAAPLVGLFDGTHARGSELLVRRLDGSADWVPSGDRAVVDAGAYARHAKGIPALQHTRSYEQEVANADDLTVWTTNAATVTSGTTSPTGASDAFDVAYDAAASAHIREVIPEANLADNTVHVFPIWARAKSGTATFRLRIRDKAGSLSGLEPQTATTDWQPFFATFDVGSGAGDVVMYIYNTGLAEAQTLEFWLPNYHEGTYPLPVARGSTAKTIAATSWEVGSAPVKVRQGRWTMPRLVPAFSVDDMASGDVFTLLSFGGAGDTLQVEHDGVDVRVRAYVGGVEKATSPAMSGTEYADHGDLVVRPADGLIALAGIDGPAGTAWTWPDSTLRIGAVQGTGADPWDGLLTPIKALRPTADEIGIILVAGQSNAVGGASSNDLSEAVPNPNRYVSLWYELDVGASTKSTTEAIDLQPHDTAMGVEMTMGQRLAPQRTTHWYIVKVAANGEALADHWLPSGGGNERYAQLLSERTDAINAIQSRYPGIPVVDKAFVWVGCEGDAADQTKANNVQTNLQALYDEIRTDTGEASLPCVHVRLHANLDRTFRDDAVAGMDAVASSDADAYSVNPDAYELKADDVHYTTAGFEDLGAALGDAILEAA